MKRLIVLIAVLSFALPGSAFAATASFVREYEQFNRSQSLERLNDLDKEIQIRVDEWKTEEEKREAEERERLGQKPLEADEVARLDKLIEERQDSWQIKPAFVYSAKRDSNVFLRRTNATGETEYSYIPSFTATKRFDAWKYQSSYEMNVLEHRIYNHNDRIEHGWTQSLTRKGNKLSALIANEVNLMKFPTELDEEKLDGVKSNNFYTSIGYTHSPKTTISGYYNNQYVDFQNTEGRTGNTLDNKFGLRLDYRLRPRFGISADYSYRFIRPPKRDETENFNEQVLKLGVNAQISPKLIWNGGVGLELAEFPTQDDTLGVTFGGVLRFQYSPRTTLALKMQRDRIPTGVETGADPLNHVFGLGISHDFSRRINFSAGQTIRLIQSDSPSTVVDPEHPEITTTKIPETVGLTTDVTLQITPFADWRVLLAYKFDRMISELQTADYTNHASIITVQKDF